MYVDGMGVSFGVGIHVAVGMQLYVLIVRVENEVGGDLLCGYAYGLVLLCVDIDGGMVWGGGKIVGV